MGAAGLEGAVGVEVADEGTDRPLRIVARRYSRLDSKGVEASGACGRFHCRSTLAPRDIDDWTDGVSAALCPNCGIGSVIGDADVSGLSGELLSRMYEYWF